MCPDWYIVSECPTCHNARWPLAMVCQWTVKLCRKVRSNVCGFYLIFLSDYWAVVKKWEKSWQSDNSVLCLLFTPTQGLVTEELPPQFRYLESNSYTSKHYKKKKKSHNLWRFPTRTPCPAAYCPGGSDHGNPASAGPGLLYAGSVASSLPWGVQRQRPAYSNNGHLFIFIFRSDN